MDGTAPLHLCDRQRDRIAALNGPNRTLMAESASWQRRCSPRGVHSAAGLAAALETVASLNVLALLEATRLTGVARNALEYARMARLGIGGVHVAVALTLIRRCLRHAPGSDILYRQAAGAGIPLDVLVERHRYDAQVVDDLRRLVHARRPHIIETHHVKSHCLMALSGLWRYYTWVAFHHGYTQTDVKVRAYNHVDRWSLRHATHIVTTNRPFADMLVARGIERERLTVLHNGVRSQPSAQPGVSALRRRLGLHDRDRVVLAVGRLSHEKGQAHLIRALATCQQPLRLVIVGDGPDRGALERLARVQRADRSVIFAGMTPDVAPFYAMADVFALPSLTEGSPNALLEAMACGLPVVATRVGGVPEIATDGQTALLVPSSDPLALGCAIDRMLADPALGARLGSAARAAVLSRHTPEQRAATLSNLYAGLAGLVCRTDMPPTRVELFPNLVNLERTS